MSSVGGGGLAAAGWSRLVLRLFPDDLGSADSGPSDRQILSLLGSSVSLSAFLTGPLSGPGAFNSLCDVSLLHAGGLLTHNGQCASPIILHCRDNQA